MAPNYRRGEHLDVTTQPWLGGPTQQRPLAKLIAGLEANMDTIRERLRKAVKQQRNGNDEYVIRLQASQFQVTDFIASTLQQIDPEAAGIRVDQRYGYGMQIDGIKLNTLTEESIYALGKNEQVPYLLILVATWRLVVNKKTGFIPGMPHGLTLAGLHFVLNQLGIDTSE